MEYITRIYSAILVYLQNLWLVGNDSNSAVKKGLELDKPALWKTSKGIELQRVQARHDGRV